MKTLQTSRISSIDLLKGLVMVIMALDHVRDYFHWSAFYYDPTDPNHSSLPIFFTRFITHFCAPAFSFLAGLSAYMVGRRKPKNELAAFLVKRGLWLIFLEFTVVNFAWYFDIYFRHLDLLVIWSLGVSMIVLAGLIYLPRKVLLVLCLVIICGHNLLDSIHPNKVWWSILHEPGFYNIRGQWQLAVLYPLIPWIAVMGLGYSFGGFYNSDFPAAKRRRLFNIIGVTAILLFFILRITNVYGDIRPFIDYETTTKDIISFFNPSKYPPSFLYLLMTLGFAFIFLANTENLRNRVVNFFSTFGRVPFFYYILHIYLLHIVAMIFAQLSGKSWQDFILTVFPSESPDLKGYGFPLWVVYVVWIGIIILLYPLCRKFDTYKQAHKEKWWLSYI